MYDDIAYYDDKTIQEWLLKFLEDEQEKIFLPGIPFSYYEVTRESIRREHCKDMEI